MAERSVIGQLKGCYWLLKLAPFCSGLPPYPIVTIAAADNDASATATNEVQTAMLTYHSKTYTQHSSQLI